MTKKQLRIPFKDGKPCKKDKSKGIRVVINTNDYITSYPASLFDMSIKEGEDIAKDHFDNIITIELYR